MGDMGTSSSKQTDVRIFFETMPSERTPVGIVGITLCLFNIAMENGPFIDDFPIRTTIYRGFSMAMLNNQMVYRIVGSIP